MIKFNCVGQLLVKDNRKPLVEKTFGVGHFKCYHNVIVGIFNEGAHVSLENVAEPIKFLKRTYGDKEPIVYVSLREHSYSMDPVGYQEILKKFPNFVGYAIVSGNRYSRVIANLEKLFIKKPIEVFYDLDEAFEWAKTIVRKHNLKVKVAERA